MQEKAPECAYKLKHVEVHNKQLRNKVHEKQVRKVVRKKHTNKKFKFNVSIGDFDMNSIILDLGFDVNMLLKKTWEYMGKPKMVWSPI